MVVPESWREIDLDCRLAGRIMVRNGHDSAPTKLLPQSVEQSKR